MSFLLNARLGRSSPLCVSLQTVIYETPKIELVSRIVKARRFNG